MTMFIFANNLSTTLAAAITNAATTITLSSAANIPTIPAGFTANRIIAIKDGSGTIYYLPLSTTSW